jgi:hypothetical protein
VVSRAATPGLSAAALVALIALALGGCPGPRFAPLDAGLEDAGGLEQEDAGALADAGAEPVDAGHCQDDTREQDDTVVQAKSRSPLYSRTPIALPGLVACPADEDFTYGFGDPSLAAGALVTWDIAAGELLVDLLDGSGTPYLLNGTNDVKERSPGRVKLIRADQSGYFILRIRSGGGARVPYDAEIYAPSP